MRTACAVTIALILIPSIGLANNMRLIDGGECHRTEKAYYKNDGVTPFACLPSGGPAYSFEVYVDDNLLWVGNLPANEASVYFNLSGQQISGIENDIYLFVERNLTADPKGSVVSFGESHLQGIKTYEFGGSSVGFPEVEKNGINIPVERDEVVTHMTMIEGSVVDFSGYRFVISPAN